MPVCPTACGFATAATAASTIPAASSSQRRDMSDVCATQWAAALLHRHRSEEQDAMPRKQLSEAEKQRALGSLRMKTPSPAKRCPQCGQTKSRSEFGVRNNGYSRSYCRPCEVAKCMRWQRANPKRVQELSRRTTLKRHWGLTEGEYAELLADQDACCAICGRHESEASRGRLHLDHCHETGRIRGLLCSPCNIAIGMFRESRDALAAAIKYLSDPPAAYRDLFAAPSLPSGRTPGSGQSVGAPGAMPLFEVHQ